jgi:hypothetical protein
MPVSSLQNKGAEKSHLSLPFIITVATDIPPLDHITPIAYIACCLAMPPIFSEVPCTLTSVNRLNSAVIVANIHHFQRGVKACQGSGFTSAIAYRTKRQEVVSIGYVIRSRPAQ